MNHHSYDPYIFPNSTLLDVVVYLSSAEKLLNVHGVQSSYRLHPDTKDPLNISPPKRGQGPSTPPPLTDDKPTWLKSQDTFYLFCACDSRMNEDALFHIFSNFVYFCQNFQILCLFLPFFLNMAYMRLFFRIGPASSKIFSNTVGSKVP